MIVWPITGPLIIIWPYFRPTNYYLAYYTPINYCLAVFRPTNYYLAYNRPTNYYFAVFWAHYYLAYIGPPTATLGPLIVTWVLKRSVSWHSKMQVHPFFVVYIFCEQWQGLKGKCWTFSSRHMLQVNVRKCHHVWQHPEVRNGINGNWSQDRRGNVLATASTYLTNVLWGWPHTIIENAVSVTV